MYMRYSPFSVRKAEPESNVPTGTPHFKGLSLAAKAAADRRTLMPTIATVGSLPLERRCDWFLLPHMLPVTLKTPS